MNTNFTGNAFVLAACRLILSVCVAVSAAFAQAPVTVTLDQAIQMALQHNHTLQAARTTIQQNQAAEVTANLRPNPTLFTDWEYLPISPQPGTSLAGYLQAYTEGDRSEEHTSELQSLRHLVCR